MEFNSPESQIGNPMIGDGELVICIGERPSVGNIVTICIVILGIALIYLTMSSLNPGHVRKALKRFSLRSLFAATTFFALVAAIFRAIGFHETGFIAQSLWIAIISGGVFVVLAMANLFLREILEADQNYPTLKRKTTDHISDPTQEPHQPDSNRQDEK